MKIRTILATLVIVLTLSTQIKAQGMPVYDNASFLTLGKSLAQGVKTVKNLAKQLKHLKEAKERIMKVANNVKAVREVEKLIKANARLIKKANDNINKIVNSKYITSEEVSIISDSFSDIIDASVDDVKFIQKLLKSDFFKMEDAERLKMIRERKESIDALSYDVDKKIETYQDIISFREMQDKINNREIAY